jgi:hypothetical protein
MNSQANSIDPDILASRQALRRAARKAQQLAHATRTPVYVLRDGRVVNLNARRKTRSSMRTA